MGPKRGRQGTGDQKKRSAESPAFTASQLFASQLFEETIEVRKPTRITSSFNTALQLIEYELPHYNTSHINLQVTLIGILTNTTS